MTSTPIQRTTARVVPVNDAGQVLLLHGHDPARPTEPYWFTIGGAIEADEAPEQAAVRELREETGIEIAVDDLTEPFHVGRHDFNYDGADYQSHSTFFAVPMGPVEVHFDGLEEGEHITDAQWWHPQDLVGAAVSNLALPDIARAAVADVRRRTGS